MEGTAGREPKLELGAGKYEEYFKGPIFLVDNMLKKLSSIMRNCGINAEYIAVKDHALAIDIASKERRIILTRDTLLFNRKDSPVPVYLLREKGDSDLMFEEVVRVFKLDLSSYHTLSRCVKCNGEELAVIPREEALKEVSFKHEERPVMDFWRCGKCRQIYWEGAQFQKAKTKFNSKKEKTMEEDS